MSEPQPVIVRSWDDLIAAFRARKEKLGLSNSHLDHMLNRSEGYTDHYIGRADKNIGPVAFTVLCRVLALQFEPRTDPKALQAMAALYERRVDSQIRVNAKPLSIWQIIGRQGGLKRREKIDEKRRKIIAKRAARARWAKSRGNKREKAEKAAKLLKRCDVGNGKAASSQHDA